jgi:hypothetical protein
MDDVAARYRSLVEYSHFDPSWSSSRAWTTGEMLVRSDLDDFIEIWEQIAQA